LFVRPGAAIEGRAVAIGGCVYASTLATVGGATVCFRDEGYITAREPGGDVALVYTPVSGDDRGWLHLPGFRGFQPPGYDRVNGVSLTWGPALGVDTTRLVVHPRVTYRSDLGAIDPAVRVRVALGRRSALTASAARTSVTNEAWIRSDLVNAFGAIVSGSDVRNYYRAERAEAQLGRRFGSDGGDVIVFVGVLMERAHPVNPDSTSTSSPFSFLNRRDRVGGMLRANPQGTRGRINSVLGGATTAVGRDDLAARAGLTVELPVEAPGGARFVQAMVDAETGFRALANHRVVAALHGVLTAGDSTPRQRYSYLGGGGTLPTEEEVLGFGGDRLLFADALYLVPLERIRLPFIGSPSVGVRYAAGSAGVRELPRFTQNVGVRLIVGAARVDLLVNPATGESAIGFGIATLR
jgi:hypothetical protein